MLEFNDVHSSPNQRRRSGRKPGARVTNSARLFTPGKMRTQRSAKFINDCGRTTLAHGWTSLISNIWRTARSGKGKDPKKYMKERLHNTKKSFFNLPFKGMIGFDLNMKHDEVHGKFVLTVCICSICIFVKKFPIAKSLCSSFQKRYN